MSTDPDKATACPKADKVVAGTGLDEGDICHEISEKKRRKPSRSVRFPDEDQLVTQYFEPANPWHDVPNTTRAQLAAEYLEGCRRHNTMPIDSVLLQIRELPENCIGGGNRAARLTLAECSLAGAAAVDALEAVLRKVQFRRLEIHYCELDDEGAEALFDMIEYYESASAVSISGPRQFGIRGWQAACRMIKKSGELSELSLCESALCASHAPVLVRALRPHSCRLRALCLQRAELRGEPLLCLVIALKSNTSIRELRLPDNQLSVGDAQQLASLLKLNLHLQLLDLSNNDIQDAGTGHIADALVEQAAQTPPSTATSPLSPLHWPPGGRDARRGLAFLVLWNNQLTRNCAPHLTKALRASHSLCVLNIGRNALGADTVRALQCGSSLVSLGLQCARLGPGAARPLADLLRADTKLQRLDLRDNRLGVAGLQAIVNAMQENTTLTQIDLDDPEEPDTLSAERGEAATVARLTRDIAALCRRNEPPATEPERRVHRKISLTCHTASAVKAAGRCPDTGRTRAVRLRSPAPSPAPSPAGSPTPHSPHGSRFNVTRVTPDREPTIDGSSPVPPRPSYCLTPSRFKVVQVAEPAEMEMYSAAQMRPPSRFSVTRNYDTMYSLSPLSASPTPSVSPVPSSPSPVTCGSPTAMSSSPTVIIGTPTAMSTSPTVIIGSPTAMSTSPAVMIGSPTVLGSLTEMSSSPTVSSSPTEMSSSPTVIVGSPTVASSLNVMSSSPTVTSSRTMLSGSTKVTTSSLTARSDLDTVSSSSPTVKMSSLLMITGSPKVTGPPIVMASSHSVMAGSFTVTSSSIPTELHTAVTNVPLLNTVPVAANSPTVINESPSLGVMVSGSQTKPMTEILANVSPTPLLLANATPTMTMPAVSALAGPNFAQASQMLTSVPTSVSVSMDTSISTSDFVTSAVKAAVSPSLTVVPIMACLSHLEDSPHEYNTDQIRTETNEQKVNTNDENSSKIFDIHTDIGCAEKDLTSFGMRTSTLYGIGAAPEYITKNVSESSYLSTVVGDSIDTLTGTIISGTRLDTLSGTTSKTLIDDDYRNIERIETLTKMTDFNPIYSDTGLQSTNTDGSELEANLGNVLETRVVPNSRFSISPIPDDFEISYENFSEEIAKRFGIGSQSNIIATNKAPVMEADIFTMLAEITENVRPTVGELKALPDSIDLNKLKIEDNLISQKITSDKKAIISQEDTPVALFTTDVSSDTAFIENVIDIQKPVTDISEEIPKENMSKFIGSGKKLPTEPKTKPSKTEDKSPCISVRSMPPSHNKIKYEIAVPFQVSVQNEIEEFDKVDLKSILQDEVSDIKRKIVLPKAIETVNLVADFESSSKLEGGSYSDSETKISESAKNKTYSDVVKSDPKYIDKSEQLTHTEEISDSVVKTETKIVKNNVEECDSGKLDVQIEVTVKHESVQDSEVHSDQINDFVNIDDIIIKQEPRTMNKIKAITEDLGNLIQEMKDMSSKSRKVKSDCTVDIVSIETNVVPGNFNRDVVLKKNKSESSLDSPDLEVSRIMKKKLVGSPFRDSSSSLEVSGSSMESLNATENQHATCHVIPKQVAIQESVESDTELDRRKDIALSLGSSVESASDVTPVNSGNYLNMSVSSNESLSPIIFGMARKIHDSLSSLEASVSSLDSGRQEKVMVTSADSGIEYSLQQPSENKEDNSSNEGTLTHNSSLKETIKKAEQETLTLSPKRTSSLLDVPALKAKSLDKMRKISWVAPSSSFQIPRAEPEKFEKPSHLEKLLSIFQHPTSLFTRSQSDDEKKSASNTPPRKDSSLTSSFWSWGSTIEKDDKEDSSEATDSTLSERVQVSFVDESFSKKLDSKTPSTDTDNTLSEFQSFPIQSSAEKVTAHTTDEDLVQKCLDLSLTDKAGSNGNSQGVSDITDLSKPNDLNRNYDVSEIDEKSENIVVIDKDETRDTLRPRSFAAVLKSSGSENTLDKQPSPESGQSVDKLPSKVIRGIKENISPENTLTSSMTNTKTLALELTERQIKNQPIVNKVWEVPILEKSELKTDEVKTRSDLAPIATIDETCDEAADNVVNVKLEFIDDVETDDKHVFNIGSLKNEENILANNKESEVKNEEIISERSAERRGDLKKEEIILEKDIVHEVARELENVDLGKDALSYLAYEGQGLEDDTERVSLQIEGSLAQELKEAAIKEMLDLSPELIIDEAVETEALTKQTKLSPVVPERAKLKKSNSLEDLSQREESAKISPKTKTIAFKVPETQPRDIPRTKLRTMSGSSPKSLPESLNKPCPLTKYDSALKKRKKVSSLGKMAKDSLLALNMSEDEIAEHRRSYATSAESLRSLESVSEDANSQSGASVDSRCRSCLRTSQESLMSLDSITEDCKCGGECERGRSVR